MKNKGEGYISQIIGAVVDVSFDNEDDIPNLLDAMVVQKDDGSSLVLECQQDIGENTVRTIAMDSTDGLRRGLPVIGTGSPIIMPVGDEIRGRLFNVIGDPIDGLGDVSKEKEMRELTGGYTVPQILIDGKAIGGYTELVELDMEGELEQTQ